MLVPADLPKAQIECAKEILRYRLGVRRVCRGVFLVRDSGLATAYFVAFLLVPGGELEPPRPCGLRI